MSGVLIWIDMGWQAHIKYIMTDYNIGEIINVKNIIQRHICEVIYVIPSVARLEKYLTKALWTLAHLNEMKIRNLINAFAMLRLQFGWSLSWPSNNLFWNVWLDKLRWGMKSSDLIKMRFKRRIIMHEMKMIRNWNWRCSLKDNQLKFQ